jgi:steroid 5-alpha reductase family enzyme
MDKLWSILPIVYTWIIVFKSGMNPRLIVMAILITIWGARLTLNFAKKGAYSIKFWSGEEDYRWVVLRKDPKLNKKWKWALFDLFFISIYQNALVLAICLPLLATMDSTVSFNIFDGLIAALLLGFIILETIADKQHPNYFSEQSIWVVLYFFCISAGVTSYVVFNWTLVGSMFLILLFIGSSMFSEGISLKKYPAYEEYIKRVSKYVPLRKYKE